MSLRQCDGALDQLDQAGSASRAPSTQRAYWWRRVFPTHPDEISAAALDIARHIRSQYTIEYSPTNAAMDGTFRAIHIAVKAAGNPAVRTRSGYYATPDAKTTDAK